MSKLLSDVTKYDEDANLVRNYNDFIGRILEWLDTDFCNVIDDIEGFLQIWKMYIEQFEELDYNTTPLWGKYEKFESKIHILDRMYNDLADSIPGNR